ncbi:uncharacterized protein LOC125772934 isoform X2 [Anopheles funestus]|uniref:uncharacterized protein LOC125772934 isoform X2 n=1 Tax=Anopheles funestus TaxID=62324 RepID=UPI0020C68555|nr:uncharacterized protein LOC125772934 isoform X2 [Anopheles funestus]
MDSSLQSSKRSGQFYRRIQKRTADEVEVEQGESSQMQFEIENDRMLLLTEDAEIVPDEDDVLEDIDYIDEVGTDEEFNFRQSSIEECLRFWALKTNAPHSSINIILKIFRAKTELRPPKDARTLLRTNQTDKEIVTVGGGHFWYNGVEKCLRTTFSYFFTIH